MEGVRDVGEGWVGSPPGVGLAEVLAAAGPLFTLAAVRDADGTVTDFGVAALNAAAAALVHHPGAELVGRRLGELDDVGEIVVSGPLFEVCRDVVDGGRPFAGIVEWFDGADLFVDVRITRVGDGCVIAGWDATEAHLAEQVLEVVDAAVDAVMSLDADAHVVYWSRAAERMYGWTAAEIFGRPASLLAPDTHPGDAATNIDLALGGERTVFETIGLRKDGTTFPVEMTVAPVRDHTGVVVRTASVHRDITERVAARAALAESEHRYRLVVDNSHDAITVTSAGVLQWASPAFTELTGADPADLIGTQLIDLIHPDDRAALDAARARLAAGLDGHPPLQVRVRRTDGAWHWAELRIGPLVDDTGDVTGTIANWHTIDEQVAYIDALARSEAHNRDLAAQLQVALDSRVRIEQAKGMVAARRGITPDEAFDVLRDHGRRHGRKLADVVHDVVELGLQP